MRRVVCVLGVSLVLLVWSAAPPALAANPEVNRFTDSWSDVDPDFCGTGVSVSFEGSARVTEFLSPNHVDFMATFSAHEVITNVKTGDYVIAHWAGRSTNVVVSGSEEGIHTHEITTIGLPESFRLPGGGKITLDAGYIVFHDTFDGDKFLSTEVTVVHGPHPAADSDFELFCEVIPPALGIE
jgi:hypothetical protein